MDTNKIVFPLMIGICILSYIAITILYMRRRQASHKITAKQIKTLAKVLDCRCAVKSIGLKIPKTRLEFVIVFQTDTGQILALDVPQEMYDGFEKGQTGLLTTVNGVLYSFVPEETINDNS